MAAALPSGTSAGDLKALVGDVKGRLGGRPAVVALFGEVDGTVPFVVAVTDAALATGVKAGALVKSFLADVDGRGGGRPELAQGSGTRPAGVDAAIASLRVTLGGSNG